MASEAVAVIIPVHNAGAFLRAALSTALTQSYPASEIIIVDDGSTDDSYKIARACARNDSRIQVLQQSQRGPSSARNLGIAASRSELIAPLDADDLWQPTKLEKQVETLRNGGLRMGLVYTWFALIDRDGRILSTGHRPIFKGDVFRECCRRNIIGNGSGALMRRDAIEKCGGYDENLKGCEDYKLYIAIAEHYHFGLVAEYLTGYRQTNDNLTSDVVMILQSAERVFDELQQRHPEMLSEILENRRELCQWLLCRSATAVDLRGVLRLSSELWKRDAFHALRAYAALPKHLFNGWLKTDGCASSRIGSRAFGQDLQYFLPERPSD